MKTIYGLIKKTRDDMDQDAGSVTVIALLIMALLTIIGVSAVNDTTTELQIARNDGIYKINFFQADGTAREAIQAMEDIADPQDELVPSSTTQSWVNDDTFDPDGEWVLTGAGPNPQNAQPSSCLANAGYAAVFNGIASGSGKDMTETTNLYDYTVYSRSTDLDGDCMIMAGYRIRF